QIAAVAPEIGAAGALDVCFQEMLRIERTIDHRACGDAPVFILIAEDELAGLDRRARSPDGASFQSGNGRVRYAVVKAEMLSVVAMLAVGVDLLDLVDAVSAKLRAQRIVAGGKVGRGEGVK